MENGVTDYSAELGMFCRQFEESKRGRLGGRYRAQSAWPYSRKKRQLWALSYL